MIGEPTVTPEEGPEERRSARLGRWAVRVNLARKATIAIAILAGALVLATYAALTGWGPFKPDPKLILILLNLDLVLFLILGTFVAHRLVRLWMERRRGAIGSRLHSRLVVLFSLVAVTPTIIVSVSSALFFSLGVQAWFSDRVRTALQESQTVAQAYLKEHQQNIRGDILAMARDLSRAAPDIALNPKLLHRVVATQGALRSLSEAMVFDSSGRILSRWSDLGFSLFDEDVPVWALDRAQKGEPVLMESETDDRVRALIKLERLVDVFLYVSRFVDSRVLGHIERTREAVSTYEELEGERSSIEITFAMMFVIVALLLLMAAIWVGLMFATRLARPISDLVNAAERVRGGDLSARVDENAADEIGTLSRAFNRMAEQLATQRDGLVEANRQVDERRHFIETVLAGVSAGVIGLDADGVINVVNRSAADLFNTGMTLAIGQRLDVLIPESRDMLEKVLVRPSGSVSGQINISRGTHKQTFLVRVSPEQGNGPAPGYVATFDDITELVSAQRMAAWSDVARRIAHEIKNPLTPIQLAAERLRRKYQGEVTSDPDAFIACTDTIIRQVGDIGRLVDEFSAFARMPAPVMKEEDLASICRDSTVLFRNAHRGIVFECLFASDPVTISCDSRQVGQALTNLLQNAVDAIEGRAQEAGETEILGHVWLDIHSIENTIRVIVSDDGKGLPIKERDRLMEPYVTTREKGTGLGLAIVRKIMEDHGGEIELTDRQDGGAVVSLVFALGRKTESVSGDSRENVVADHGV